MGKVHLSYVLTTFNKLNYLKVTLPLLMNVCQADEEIVVVDGASDDGTPDYLEELRQTGKIHTFLSEKDKGEAEGLNKALLLAKGDLIKIITDDDLFDFTVIKECKEFMMKHPDLDVMGADGYSCRIGEYARFEKTGFIEGYRNWQKEGTAFLFCGLSLMIRRSSLSYLGLFSTAYKIVDMEYSLRISSLKSRIAFCTKAAFINMVNPASNSIKYYEDIRREHKQLRRNYSTARISFKINNPILKMKERIHHMLPSRKPGTDTDHNLILQQYLRLVERGQHLLLKSNSMAGDFLMPAT